MLLLVILLHILSPLYQYLIYTADMINIFCSDCCHNEQTGVTDDKCKLRIAALVLRVSSHGM